MGLFETGYIGKLELRNRLIMPAMSTQFASIYGEVTERLVNYYVARSKGGVGLITVEITCVDSPIGRAFPSELRVDHDKFISGLGELAEAIKAYGARASLQLHHAGRRTGLFATDDLQPVSASDIVMATPRYGARPRALSVQEIEDIVEKFGEGARRAKTAGFDAVELHGAHGYLIAQFMSPYSNKRMDEYGVDFEGRMRFPLEIVARVREKVGEDFPIIFKLSGDEFVEGGLTVKNTRRMAQRLEKAGVDAIVVSAGKGEGSEEAPPMATPKGVFVHLAEEIKKVVDIPIVAVGRINDPILAENIIKEGRADFVAIGRALIADPEWPIKYKEGRPDDIRKCIACNRGCNERLGLGLNIRCDVNAQVGKEGALEVEFSDLSLRVLVIGGGPAGMEAARVAALRGHEVSIWEKEEELGGQLNICKKPPHKEEINNILEYLTNQIRKLDVEVEINKTATIETIEGLKPDAVIVATGATPLIPDIPGVGRYNVTISWDLLSGKTDVGDIGTNVIVAGGGEVGLETAEFLAEKDKRVTVVEMLGDVGMDMEATMKAMLLPRLHEKKVRILTNRKILAIQDDGVTVFNLRKLAEEKLSADNVVLALGSKPNNELYAQLTERSQRVFVVGDAVEPRRIGDAVREGWRTAIEL